MIDTNEMARLAAMTVFTPPFGCGSYSVYVSIGVVNDLKKILSFHDRKAKKKRRRYERQKRKQ